MITFKQFLNEEEEIKDLVTMIKKDCGPFLSESKRNGMLYRGFKSPKTDYKYVHHPESTAEDDVIAYTIGTTRTDRRPADTDPQIHQRLDVWFKQHLGFKARSESLFCFGPLALDSARPYGKVHCIFPIGDFAYAWADDVPDLYGELESKHYFKNHDDPVHAFEDWMSHQGYRSTGLDKALASECEIMVKCSKYYAFSLDYSRVLEKALDIQSWYSPE